MQKADPKVDSMHGTPGGIRTPDPLFRRQMLYPAELPVRVVIHYKLRLCRERQKTSLFVITPFQFKKVAVLCFLNWSWDKQYYNRLELV